MTTVWTTCRRCGGFEVPFGYVGDVVGPVCMCRFEGPAGAGFSDELSRIIAERDALRSEVERLTGCLKRANDQAEHFERHWYLRGDEVEALRADAERLRADLNAAQEGGT